MVCSTIKNSRHNNIEFKNFTYFKIFEKIQNFKIMYVSILKIPN